MVRECLLVAQNALKIHSKRFCYKLNSYKHDPGSPSVCEPYRFHHILAVPSRTLQLRVRQHRAANTPRLLLRAVHAHNTNKIKMPSATPLIA